MMTILVIGILTTGIKLVIQQLHGQFALKTLGSINHFLRSEAYKGKSGLYLFQVSTH